MEHLPLTAAPTAVRALDLAAEITDVQLPAARDGGAYVSLAAFVRRAGAPLGWISVDVPPSGTVTAVALLAACAEQLRERQDDHAPASAVTDVDAELISVVIPTCADAEAAIRCITEVRRSDAAPFEIVVVENRPARSDVRAALADAFGADPNLRYIEEPVPGLSNARNAGLAAARGTLVAFIDDDVLVDERWLASLRSAFAAHPDASCVTGMILPSELETEAQLLLERFATFSKGLEQRTFRLSEPPPEMPLFPYTAGHFGSGANMAFRTAALRALGGFDPVLGAGTKALGGEDLDICLRLILAGRTIVYEPRAVVWHKHPDTLELLERQAFHYGFGLGASLTKQLVAQPGRLRMLSLIPRGVHYLLSPGSRKNAQKGSDFPLRITSLERVGLLLGPLGYARSRWRARPL